MVERRHTPVIGSRAITWTWHAVLFSGPERISIQCGRQQSKGRDRWHPKTAFNTLITSTEYTMTHKREPFAMVSLEIIADDRLSKMQLRVLLALLTFRNVEHDMVWPHRATLAARCGYSPRTITRVTTELCKLGWLKKSGKGGFGKPCLYHLTVPESVTVIDSSTVPEPVLTTVPEPVQERCPDQALAKKRPITDKRTYQSTKAARSKSTTNSIKDFAKRVSDRSWAEGG